MISHGKHSILGVNVHAVDYEYAVSTIVDAARRGEPCSVSALATHGVLTGKLDPAHARRLNGLDLVVPDGQPVRWALSWLYGIKLPDRVYGPNLTLKVVEAYAQQGLPLYFYGSTPEVLEKFVGNLRQRFPKLVIAGAETSKFRRLTDEEKLALSRRIIDSGAKGVIVGLGCPRQEVWAYEYRNLVRMPILAVGAAFDFHAGTLKQAPGYLQDRGLEWLYRLVQEPKRLWRRYLVYNTLYIFHLGLQLFRLRAYPAVMPDGREPVESYG
jgi:exopolysaccharide biosynthesis WecB/TagA/CpsF family protein